MERLLEAVRAENAMVDDVHRDAKEAGGAEGWRVEKNEKGRGVSPRVSQGGPSPASQQEANTFASPGLNTGEISSDHTGPTSHTVNKTGLLEFVDPQPNKANFPIKPSLLSYDITNLSKPQAKPTSCALEPAHASNQKPGEQEEGVASKSLTDRTLKIITGKVRNMNSKYVNCTTL
jgi:hypothetical protein